MRFFVKLFLIIEQIYTYIHTYIHTYIDTLITSHYKLSLCKKKPIGENMKFLLVMMMTMMCHFFINRSRWVFFVFIVLPYQPFYIYPTLNFPLCFFCILTKLPCLLNLEKKSIFIISLLLNKMFLHYTSLLLLLLLLLLLSSHISTMRKIQQR